VVLLNNAAQASPDAVLLRARVLPQSLLLEVIDRGGGLILARPEGWGVGLELARATLERIGGSLEIGASRRAASARASACRWHLSGRRDALAYPDRG
jgi:signal transduction histidine kinase